MENLDGTILITATPSIGHSLGVPALSVGVTITAYLLTLAVLIPLSGWIAERFGSRRVFLAAIIVFTAASLLCAISTSLFELTLMRVIQGVGGAMMVPVGRLAVLRVTDRTDLVRTIALLTWPALVAPVIAPLLGGLLTTYASWHWIFLINVPLGVVAFIVALRLLPNEPVNRPDPLDWAGLVLTCAGLGLLVYAGSLLTEPVSPPLELALFWGGGAALTGLAVAHLLRSRHPLLHLRTLGIGTFRLAHSSGSLFRLTVSAVPFLLPLLFQSVFGWSPVRSGILVLCVFVGNIVIKPATTPLLRRFGFRTVILGSTLALALSIAAMAAITAETPLLLTAAILVVSGSARSVGFTAYNTIAFADIEREQMTDANTLASTLQQLAAGFGVTIGALALSVGQGFGVEGVPYRIAFFVLAALCLVATAGAVRLATGAGDNIRPRRA